MIKENMIDQSKISLETALKKAFGALKSPLSEKMIKDMVLELISLTCLKTNFANLCIFAFNEEKEFSRFAVRTAVDIVSKAENPSSLKTAASCASVSLLLKSEDDFDDARILSQKIFQSNRPPEEFALQFFLSSSTEDKEQLVSFMISLLHLPEPWCNYAEKVISSLIRDVRFASVLDLAYLHFGAVVSSSKTGIFKMLGTSLFQLDKSKFISTLLLKSSVPSKQVINLLASIFDVVGKTLIEVSTNTKVEEKLHLHLATARIIASVDNIPQEDSVNILVLICLIIAQNHKLLPDCRLALNNLAKNIPEINSPRIQSLLQEAEATKGPIPFVTIRSLFTLISSQLTIYHLKGFLNFAPYGALAGYCELTAQGRPMLPEIMAQTKVVPNAVLLALPSIKQLTPDRYGEYMINQVLTFITQEMHHDEDAFRAILELFEWIPQKLILENCTSLFTATVQALRVEDPPQSAFNCVSMFADSKIFVSNKEFRKYLWMMAVVSLGFSEGVDMQLVAVARTALCSLAQHAAMFGTVAIIQNNIGKLEGFSIALLPTFVREMDDVCIDSALSVLEDPSINQKIRASELICASIQTGRYQERRPQLRLLPLLASEDDRIKLGVLNALRTFPPKL
jgi:hypothetical protein